jgi:rod shape-determining protein MreC
MRYRSLAVFLLLIALLINVPPVNKSPVLGSFRSAVLLVFYPFQFVLDSLTDNTLGLARFVVSAKRFEEENRQLKGKLDQMEARQQALGYLEEENESLRRTLVFRDNRPYKYYLQAAEIIGRGGNPWADQIIINKGSEAGVTEGMTVICREGLVGNIFEVSKYSSKVLLITSSQSRVSALLTEAGVFGIVQGGYGRILKLKYIPEDTEIATAESVVVSPASSTYIRGIAIGRVSRVDRNVDQLFCEIEVQPAVDFSRLGMVYICRP